MKIFIMSLTLLSTLFLACKKEENIILKGTLGKYKTEIILSQKNDKFDGSFNYMDKSISDKSVKIEGTRIAGKLRLEEFNDEHKLTGIFEGKFDGNSFIGNWKSPSGEDETPFRFSKKSLKIASKRMESSPEFQYILIDHPEGITAHQGISAKLDNKTYEIIKPNSSNDLRCIDIYNIDDYNGNGYDDVLLTDIAACGGNCCPSEYFFCSYSLELDKFIITENFGASWGGPIIEDHSGKTSIKLVNNSQGAGYTEMKEITSWTILEGNEAKVIESKEREQLDAITEIRASEMDKEKATLKFDINKDGIMDEINAEYWLRWGTLDWEVRISNSKVVLAGSGKRIGILSTSTNGVYDLVNSFDEIYTWNGSKYNLKK